MQVDVRCAGELPGAQVVVVGLSGGGRVELDDVALGVELDERGGVVGADQRRERAGRDESAPERRGGDRPTHGQEPVEGVGERLDGVDVGVDAERGLGVAGSDDLLGGEAPEQRGRVGGHGLGRLGEDVVGLPVVAVAERAVASRVPGLQVAHPRRLCGHPDVGVSLVEQLGVQLGPDRVLVAAGRVVEPLDHDGPVELGRDWSDSARATGWCTPRWSGPPMRPSARSRSRIRSGGTPWPRRPW